ncbi:tripartite tricarboxylate transporter substrate binding protein [Verticiella sediminum]|uniref:Tripartite tricarboxylate transporter substrate binding protein n=1 Tax=Verticiella sediminum TaxID=1247510 RepID=A0A556AJ89_9BURK|nr:tripartite tricarboxylate transporter substrate binding protein [Verticiella sediminum]TSH92941.1 tripartite tricarboxylate transporter substrate binding protein [Verticiella sediminum]
MKPTIIARRRLLAALALGSLLAPLPAVHAAPANQPIRLVVPFPPGGGTDAVARLLGNHLGDTLGVPVVIENRAGASGVIGIEAAARLPADGNNIVIGQADNLAVAPLLIKSVTYDAQADFQAVAHVADIPLLLVTATEQPYQTLADVVQAGRADPLLLTFGSAGVGTTPHLAGELFAQAADIKMHHISYKGSAPALTDVVAGRVTLMVSSISLAVPMIQSGKLRALAVTGAERSAALPDVPTVAEAANLPGFDVGTWYGIFAPKGTPQPAIERLNTGLNDVLRQPEVRAFLETQEGGVVRGGEPQALAERLAADIPRWRQVIADAGITLD